VRGARLARRLLPVRPHRGPGRVRVPRRRKGRDGTQLEAWFGALGLPILALGGYSSQTFTRQVRLDARRQRRPAVLLYGGDFDPSGEDIDRDFTARTGCFRDVVRVALTSDQVAEHELPPQPGKATDSRADGFVARHGRLVQVELDALPPEVLRALYQARSTATWTCPHTTPWSSARTASAVS
jgi:hypothetical protein